MYGQVYVCVCACPLAQLLMFCFVLFCEYVVIFQIFQNIEIPRKNGVDNN